MNIVIHFTMIMHDMNVWNAWNVFKNNSMAFGMLNMINKSVVAWIYIKNGTSKMWIQCSEYIKYQVVDFSRLAKEIVGLFTLLDLWSLYWICAECFPYLKLYSTTDGVLSSTHALNLSTWIQAANTRHSWFWRTKLRFYKKNIFISIIYIVYSLV